MHCESELKHGRHLHRVFREEKEPDSALRYAYRDRSNSETLELWSAAKHRNKPEKNVVVIAITPKTTEALFKLHLAKWKAETRFWSSVHALTNHPSYKRIIALEGPVVPLILNELRENGGSWFFALRRLTKENPVRPEDVGYIDRMTEAWLEWGRNNL